MGWVLFPVSTVVHWARVWCLCGDSDKHQDFPAVAVLSWEAVEWAAVVLTHCPGDASARMNL